MIPKKVVIIAGIAILAVGVLIGFFITKSSSEKALAVSGSSTVDRDTLEKLYQAVFGRPLDEDGAKFHIGRDLKIVLKDISDSHEHRYYAALFKAVKAYEEALRAPGTISDEDKKRYLDTIDSALATLIAWVETLPEKPICNSTIGPEQAREAIREAYERMNDRAKDSAEHGIFNALTRIGRPHTLPLPVKRCLTRILDVSPSPTSTPTPSPTPSASPSASPTASPTPSPTAVNY